MHAKKRGEKITGTGPKDKTIVMGVIERGGEVRASVVPTRRKGDVQSHVREHVLAGSALFTDALKSYEGLSEFQHEVIDHAVAYVDGEVHTNSMENFWSLLKRGLHGTYVSVEPYHLFRYLDEQCFRFNKREFTDADRFLMVCNRVAGKRLTWNTLIGKSERQDEATGAWEAPKV
jgi:transposase-like protein